MISQLGSQGFQIHTVRYVEPNSAVVTWAEGTDETAANAALAAFDWSEAAQGEWAESQRRNTAKRLLNSSDPMPLATRAGGYGNMLSTQECRAKVNEILAYLRNPALGVPADLQTGDTLAEALGHVAQLIDAGIV